MPKLTLDFEFAVGDRVVIDEGDIVGVIARIAINYSALPNRPTQIYYQYEVEWFASGVRQTGMFDEWRLTRSRR